MRILMLAPRAPYPTTYGAALRNLHILQWLGRRHEVTLVAFGDSRDREADRVLRSHARNVYLVPPPFRSIGDRVRDLALTTHPDLTRRLWSADMIQTIESALGSARFDLVQIEGLEMYSLWLAAAARTRYRPKVILDEHNAEYALQASAAAASWRRGSLIGGAYSSIQALRLRRYERMAIRGVDGVVAVSKEDLQTIDTLSPGRRRAVVPNGVDTAEFTPVERPPPGGRALFIGKLDYRPNVDAVEWLRNDIWPRIRRSCPIATLDIVGRDPLPRVSRLGGSDGVTVVGEVADERPWFQQADLLVVPMRMGSGVRLKVLQAMATGTPIVSTTLGIAGVAAEDGNSVLIGDSSAEFARQTVRLLGDQALQRKISAAALTLVRTHFDWRVILPRLDEFIQEIVGNV